MLFRFTVFYSTIFYCISNAYFAVSVSNFLACKTIQSVFLALQVTKEFLKPLHIFLHFFSKFLHKIIQKGYFGHFLQVEPILVPTFVSESFQLVYSSIKIINQILSKNHFSIASESVWVVLVPRGILVFSRQNFDREVF